MSTSRSGHAGEPPEPGVSGEPGGSGEPGELRVGEAAPPFSLEGIDGRTGDLGEWSLSDFEGAPLVLAFYPADDTPVCTAQLKSYTEHVGLLAESGAALVAISPQDPQSHRRFAAAHGGFAFPLLSDIDRSVGADYAVLGLLDLYRRTVVIVDAEGCIAAIHRSIGPGSGYQPLAEMLDALASSVRTGSQ